MDAPTQAREHVHCRAGRLLRPPPQLSVTAWAEKVSLLQSLELKDGQAIEVQGFLKPNTYTDKHGIVRTGEDLTLDALTY
jgi:hypothetical protein